MKLISKLSTIVAISFLTVSCGGGGSSSGGGSNNRADASVDPVNGPSCKGADVVSRNSTVTKCDWVCAEYNGQTGSVSLIFLKKSNGWVFDDAIVSSPCPG